MEALGKATACTDDCARGGAATEVACGVGSDGCGWGGVTVSTTCGVDGTRTGVGATVSTVGGGGGVVGSPTGCGTAVTCNVAVPAMF